MEGRKLLQYLIDTSDVVLAKKQEATEYLAKLEEAAQQCVQRTVGAYCVNCGTKLHPSENTCPNCFTRR